MKVSKLLFLKSMALVLVRSEWLELAKLLFWHSMALVSVRTGLLEMVALSLCNWLELIDLVEDNIEILSLSFTGNFFSLLFGGEVLEEEDELLDTRDLDEDVFLDNF